MPTPLRTRTQTATEPPETGDAELVRLAQASPHAFAALYLRYRDPVINYCYYRLGDREESEDAASVVFIKALDHLPRFGERGDSFRAWLFRSAVEAGLQLGRDVGDAVIAWAEADGSA